MSHRSPIGLLGALVLAIVGIGSGFQNKAQAADQAGPATPQKARQPDRPAVDSGSPALVPSAQPIAPESGSAESSLTGSATGMRLIRYGRQSRVYGVR